MPQFRFILLRWAPLFLITAVGIIAVNLVWLIPTIRNIRSSASLLSLEILDRVHSDITTYLENSLKDMSIAAEEIALEPERTRIVMERFLKNNPGFGNVAIADRGGHESQRVDKYKIVTPDQLQDHSREPHFYLALEGAPNLGEIFLSSEFEPQARLAVPVRRLGETEKVLLADLNLRDLVLSVRSIKVEGLIYLVDRNGFQVVHPEVTELLRRSNFSDRPIVQKVIIDGKVADGLSSQDEYINQSGIRVFVVGKPIPTAGLGIFFEQPRSRALAGERQAILFALTTVVLGMLIFAFIIRANSRLASLNQRLRELLAELDGAGKMLVRRDLELTRANTRLQELDVIKSEFVSVAAHQLRTPLTGIKWALNSLLEESDDPNGEQKKIVNDALIATGQLTELINDLLNVARIEEGRFGFNLQAQSILPVIRSVTQQYLNLAKEKGIDFKVEIPEKLPELNLDQEKIAMAFENLLENAVKYTSPGGKISLRATSAKEKVIFEVKDTGIGIPKDQTHKIFNKFFRSSNAKLYQTSGTGLGLYVSRNIVEQHGGAMWFESEEEKGSTFYFSLPIPKS